MNTLIRALHFCHTCHCLLVNLILSAGSLFSMKQWTNYSREISQKMPNGGRIKWPTCLCTNWISTEKPGRNPLFDLNRRCRIYLFPDSLIREKNSFPGTWYCAKYRYVFHSG